MVKAAFGNKRILWFFIVLLLCAILWWYWREQSGRPLVKLPADAKVQIKIERLDLALKQTDTLNQNRVQALKAKYGEIFKVYVENVVALTGVNDPELYVELNAFLSDPYIDTLFGDVAKRFDQTDYIEAELSEALSYYHYFFPDAPRIRAVGMVSGFQYKHALSDSSLLFGLDLHLGKDYPFYAKVSYLTNYMLPRLEAAYMVSDGIKLLIDDLIPPVEGNQLIDEVVRAGKILYIAKSCMPALHDSILLGFTADQTYWAYDSERSMWEYLVEQNLLFSSDVKVISRFMNDGPFTAGLPEGSPARMAAFTGWRMVHRFMNKHPDLPLADLPGISAAEILKKSGYKGKS